LKILLILEQKENSKNKIKEILNDSSNNMLWECLGFVIVRLARIHGSKWEYRRDFNVVACI
jgi:hypothetical protein